MPQIIGQIPEFYAFYDDWNVYEERMEQFFAVNEFPPNKRTALLISCIGSTAYKVLRDLCHPVLPKHKTFEELCAELRKQFTPQIAIFRERVQFYRAQQEEGESVINWFARLKKLAVDCKFHSNLELVLLDKFVTGLRNGPILDRVCEENETITLTRALDICASKECAIKDVTSDNHNHNNPYPPIPVFKCGMTPYNGVEQPDDDKSNRSRIPTPMDDVEPGNDFGAPQPEMMMCGRGGALGGAPATGYAQMETDHAAPPSIASENFPRLGMAPPPGAAMMRSCAQPRMMMMKSAPMAAMAPMEATLAPEADDCDWRNRDGAPEIKPLKLKTRRGRRGRRNKNQPTGDDV